MQFSIYSVTHGFAMFLPEILNRMATNTNDYFHDRGMMCDLIHMKPKINETSIMTNQKVSSSFSFNQDFESLDYQKILMISLISKHRYA